VQSSTVVVACVFTSLTRDRDACVNDKYFFIKVVCIIFVSILLYDNCVITIPGNPLSNRLYFVSSNSSCQEFMFHGSVVEWKIVLLVLT
jgi:hypothetical protein